MSSFDFREIEPWRIEDPDCWISGRVLYAEHSGSTPLVTDYKDPVIFPSTVQRFDRDQLGAPLPGNDSGIVLPSRMHWSHQARFESPLSSNEDSGLLSKELL